MISVSAVHDGGRVAKPKRISKRKYTLEALSRSVIAEPEDLASALRLIEMYRKTLDRLAGLMRRGDYFSNNPGSDVLFGGGDDWQEGVEDGHSDISALLGEMIGDLTGPIQIEKRRLMLQDSLANPPIGYSDCRNVVADLNHVFRKEAARILGPKLNAGLRRKPQDTYAEKQALASWVNNELRQLGLAIRDPASGKPAILVADVKGGPDSPSRFRLQIRGKTGARTRTISSSRVPELELMEDDVREEGLSKHRS